MHKSEQRLLTTHAGSLPRPAELTRLYARQSRGEVVPAAELEVEGKAALRRVVAEQIEAGIDVANNGEQQRDSFVLYVRDRLSGLGGTWQRRQRADVERYPTFKQKSFDAIAGKDTVDDIRGLTRALGEDLDSGPVTAECADFKAMLEESKAPFSETFLTAPSPGMVSAIVLNEYYPSEEAFLGALAEALRVEYETIIASGFLLRLDCPDLAREPHNTYQDRPLEDFLDFANRVIDAINHALRNIPRERVRMHVCWGNYEGSHDCDVPLQDIIPLLARAKVGGFVLPFANPRHEHEFRYAPQILRGDDQIIVAGVIDTTTNFVEHTEVVADRLERLAAVVGDPRRIMAGTDCGFETIAGGGRIAEDVAWAKLKALSDGARLASSRLF
jgi:5-methyltetrahydropteroyltriglutamate--homocysteine methyltransferase